ncbi:MAG: DNA cytosine methyltransferase [Martelella sp.]
MLKALDLFCCAGGASEGLERAGFDVTGVDIKPRRNYPYRLIEADAVTLDIDLHQFDFIWASPPCQRYSVSTKARADYDPENYPDLIDPIRQKLAGHPFTCIENVPAAPLRPDLVLTGPSVGLTRIERRRIFELSFFCLQPGAPRLPRSMWRNGEAITITTSLSAKSHFYPRKRAGKPGRVPPAEAAEAMGIFRPMTGHEIGEAIPPAYAEFIAREAIRQGCGSAGRAA